MYKTFKSIIGSLLFIYICNSSSSFAQSSYVTDDFEIMLRAGPSIQNKIIRTLHSGANIVVLREDAGNGHSQIQTDKGEIGYMLTRFISLNVPARNQLEEFKNQLSELKSKPGQLRKLLATSQEERRDLVELNKNLSSQLQNAQNDLARINAVSGDVVKISTENESLQSEVQQLLLQLDDIRIQNETLKDQTDRIDNMITVGILLIGLFLGWVLSISGRRRRNSWGS